MTTATDTSDAPATSVNDSTSTASVIIGADHGGYELKEKLKKSGLVISGTSPDGELVEIIEAKDHPWFLGCQFHPEFKSRPMNAHPIFREFIRASLEYSKNR